MGPVAGAVHAIEAKLSRPVRIGIPLPHPADQLVDLGPNAPDVVDGEGDTVPVVIGAGDIVMHPAAFDQGRFEHEGAESVLKHKILKQPGPPSVPLVQIVSALAHGDDPLGANHSGNEAEIVITVIVPGN